jgi:hypothetical protein
MADKQQQQYTTKEIVSTSGAVTVAITNVALLTGVYTLDDPISKRVFAVCNLISAGLIFWGFS